LATAETHDRQIAKTGVVRVPYFLVVGMETHGRETGYVADLPPGRLIVDELKKAITHKFSSSREDLVVFDSLESLKTYRQAQASGNPELAPEVGIVRLIPHVVISLTHDAAPGSHHGPRTQAKVLDLDATRYVLKVKAI